MSMDLRYDKHKKILYCLCAGAASIEEFDATMALIVSADEYPPDVSVLWNVQAIDANTFDVTMVAQIASIRKAYPTRGDSKLAIVASDDIHFGLSRMYEMMTDEMPQGVHVFRSMADAEQWLVG